MLNMDQYGSTYKKCDVYHIIRIKLQDTRTPRPSAAGAPDLARQRPIATAKALNTHAPPVSCPLVGGIWTVPCVPCPPVPRSIALKFSKFSDLF